MPNVHDLKLRLASVCSSLDRIDRHLIGGEDRTRELEELEALLLEATDITGALIGGPGAPAAELARLPPLDLNDYLIQRESWLHSGLGQRIQLTFEWRAKDAQVLASAQDLDAILNSLIESAVAARPFGGVLTISTAWLDFLGRDDEPEGAPQPFVRITVAENHEPHDSGLSLIASVAPIVRQLRGFVMLDRTPDQRRRIHVCLPIVSAAHGTAA